MFKSWSASSENRLKMDLSSTQNQNNQRVFCTSPSTRFILVDIPSLCALFSLASFRPWLWQHVSWLVKNHRCTACGFWLISMIPTLDFEWRFTACSKAMPVETFENGCFDLLTKWFPSRNSIWTRGCSTCVQKCTQQSEWGQEWRENGLFC